MTFTTEPQLMTAELVMEMARPADQNSWSDELRIMWSEDWQRARLLAIMDSVLAVGFTTPVAVGPDSRVRDGHHRLAVAAALGIMLPVQLVGADQ